MIALYLPFAREYRSVFSDSYPFCSLRFFFFFEFYFIYVFFIQQVLFYTYQCMYVNPNLPLHTPPLSPLGVHTFVLVA